MGHRLAAGALRTFSVPMKVVPNNAKITGPILSLSGSDFYFSRLCWWCGGGVGKIIKLDKMGGQKLSSK